MFGIVRIVIFCIAVIVFLVGVCISSVVLKQIAFLIAVVWGIVSVVLQKRYGRKR